MYIYVSIQMVYIVYMYVSVPHPCGIYKECHPSASASASVSFSVSFLRLLHFTFYIWHCIARLSVSFCTMKCKY